MDLPRSLANDRKQLAYETRATAKKVGIAWTFNVAELPSQASCELPH